MDQKTGRWRARLQSINGGTYRRNDDLQTPWYGKTRTGETTAQVHSAILCEL